MNALRLDARIENLVTWFAASVLTAAAVIYAVKQDEDRRRKGDAFAGRGAAAEPPALQRARSEQDGRGRAATTPAHIPWRGWKDILIRTYHEIQNDRLLSIAAGVVFYCLVALFPAIAAGVSSYALFADAASISNHLSLLSNIVPSGALDILREEITRIASRADGRLTLGFVIGLVVALWSANAGMKAVFDALNIINDETEKRSFIRLNLISLFFTFCAIAGVLVALGAIVVFPLIMVWFGMSSFDLPFIGLLRWPLLFGLIILALAVLYRYGPSRTKPQWRWLTVGSVFAATAWLAVSSLFSWYLANFANYNATYGALGAVIGLMMWMWLSTVVVLLGAQLNSEIEHQIARDTTVGGRKPLGARGAVMADSVGEAKAA